MKSLVPVAYIKQLGHHIIPKEVLAKAMILKQSKVQQIIFKKKKVLKFFLPDAKT